MAKNRFLYHLLALAVVAVWGVTFVSTKKLIGAGMHPAAIFVIRFLMAYAGIWVLTLLEKKPVRLWADCGRDEGIFVFLGITGGSFYFLTENTAQTGDKKAFSGIGHCSLHHNDLGVFFLIGFHGCHIWNDSRIRRILSCHI